MNKVIYFTTAQRMEDFEKSLPNWKVAPNTSNQNFHNKLIRSIATIRDVEVISVRPINKNYKLKKLHKNVIFDGKITWNYPLVKASKLDKFLFLKGRTRKLSHKAKKDDVVFVDVLNLSLLKAAKSFAKRHHLSVIGVCTDDPRNISFTKSSYSEKLLKLARTLDGYICLTVDLAELFNVEHKRNVIIDGVTEESKLKPEPTNRPYIFFCGSLMHAYGVYNLVNAFNNMKLEGVDLLICGHHEEENFQTFLKSMENVKYLGVLSYEEIIRKEKGALFAINPRPINDKIDKYSIPSKVLEALANGVVTISTESEILKDHYKDVIIWSKSGEIEDLIDAMHVALNLSEKEKADLISAGKKAVRVRTSLESVAAQIEVLL